MTRAERGRGGWAVGSVVEVVGIAVYVVTARIVFSLDSWEGPVPDDYSLGFGTITLMLLAAGAVVVVVHEAGHALAGALVGFRPFRVVIGCGPTLARFRVGPTNVELHAFPFTGGLTEMGTRHARSLWARHAVAVLGGPLLPVLAAVTLVRWEAPTIGLEVMRLAAITVIVYTTVMSLLPYRHRGMQSDGMHLVECLRQDPETHRQLLMAHDALELRDAVSTADANRIAALRSSADPIVASVAALAAEDWDAAIALTRDSIAESRPDQVTTLRNNLAYALARRCAPGDIEEALPVVAMLDPSADGVIVADTIALVLLRAGRPGEALPLLKSALAEPSLLGPARAEVSARLAEAAYATGDAHLGRRSLGAALRTGGADAAVELAIGAAAGPEAAAIHGFWAGCSGDDDSRAAELASALGEDVRTTIAVLARVGDDDPDIARIVDALRRSRGRRTSGRPQSLPQ